MFRLAVVASFVTLLTLKLVGILSWSWIWVFAPLWIPVAGFFALALIAGTTAALLKD